LKYQFLFIQQYLMPNTINHRTNSKKAVAEVKQKYIEAAASKSCDWWNIRKFEIIKDVVTQSQPGQIVWLDQISRFLLSSIFVCYFW
ncbi:MAG: hypothetical protein P8Y68_19705, partial [Anaerolineales bacterium]